MTFLETLLKVQLLKSCPKLNSVLLLLNFLISGDWNILQFVGKEAVVHC